MNSHAPIKIFRFRLMVCSVALAAGLALAPHTAHAAGPMAGQPNLALWKVQHP